MSIQASRYDTRAPEAPRVLAWQDDVAKSIAESTSGEAQHVSPQTIPAASAPSGVVINNHIITTTAPPVVVTRYKAEGQKASDEISTRTFIGTVLGAAAGGIIMYAMAKGSEQSNKQLEPQRIATYRTIEAPPAPNLAVPSPATEHGAYSQQGSVVNSRTNSRPIPIEGPSRSHTETALPHSVYSRHSQGPGTQILSPSTISRMPATEPRPSHAVSHAPSSQRTIRQADMIPLPPSAPATEARSARNVPLPYSVATSRASRDREYTREDSRGTVVSPHDSISQVSTKRSKASGKSKHYREEDEYRSSKGSKAGSKTGSKSGSRVTGFKVMGERGTIPGF